jgi:hypothetical protein
LQRVKARGPKPSRGSNGSNQIEPRDFSLQPGKTGAQTACYSSGVSASRENERVGLCASCKHSRQIKSDRGAIFWFCELSANDPRFPKYPRLPVVACAGYDELNPHPPGRT